MKIKQNIAISESGWLFNPDTGESFSVNPIGIEFINLMKEGKSMEEITQIMTEKYNVEEPTLEKDLYDFKGMLRSQGLTEKEKDEEEV